MCLIFTVSVDAKRRKFIVHSSLHVHWLRKILFTSTLCVLQRVSNKSDDCGAKYNITVISDLFEGKQTLLRHRLVYGILREELKTIHALTLKTLTAEECKSGFDNLSC